MSGTDYYLTRHVLPDTGPGISAAETVQRCRYLLEKHCPPAPASKYTVNLATKRLAEEAQEAQRIAALEAKRKKQLAQAERHRLRMRELRRARRAAREQDEQAS